MISLNCGSVQRYRLLEWLERPRNWLASASTYCQKQSYSCSNYKQARYRRIQLASTPIAQVRRKKSTYGISRAYRNQRKAPPVVSFHKVLAPPEAKTSDTILVGIYPTTLDLPNAPGLQTLCNISLQIK